MDSNTQQNAGVVQSAATAADSLQQQARELVELVNVFNLGRQATASRSTVQQQPPLQLANTAAAPDSDDGWEEE